MLESENDERVLREYYWKIIKSSSCSDIQEAIEGRKPTDFDLEALRIQAEFVLTTPPDWQASPKKPIPAFPKKPKK